MSFKRNYYRGQNLCTYDFLLMTIKCDTLDKTNGSPEGDTTKTEKVENWYKG